MLLCRQQLNRLSCWPCGSALCHGQQALAETFTYGEREVERDRGVLSAQERCPALLPGDMLEGKRLVWDEGTGEGDVRGDTANRTKTKP